MNNALATKELSFDLLKGIILGPVTAGFNLAIIGPPGVGKSTMCQELIREAFKSSLKCLYVITNTPIAIIKDQLREMGVAPVARNEPVIFVDMYSWLLGERSTERFQIDNASDVAAMSVVLSSAAEAAGDKSFVVFDTLSTLLAYNSEELTVRFMKSHLARMKRHGNIGAYAIETGIHSNSFYNEVKASFDGVIEMKLEEMDGELRRFIRVYRYRGAHETKWFRLLIGPDRGVKIY
ncbi:MAG TPA: RAD55 family ATPase [Candidatus Angelobacter sp.]|nr:RAD55 family ATPase [Candidatus Angelobacter sp.]